MAAILSHLRPDIPLPKFPVSVTSFKVVSITEDMPDAAIVLGFYLTRVNDQTARQWCRFLLASDDPVLLHLLPQQHARGETKNPGYTGAAAWPLLAYTGTVIGCDVNPQDNPLNLRTTVLEAVTAVCQKEIG